MTAKSAKPKATISIIWKYHNTFLFSSADWYLQRQYLYTMKLLGVIVVVALTLTISDGFNINTESGMKTISSPIGTTENPAFFGYDMIVSEDGR